MAITPDEGILIRYHCDCERCSPRGGALYFFYGAKEPTFAFPAVATKQKERTLISGFGEAREIDACSSVPSIDESKSYGVLADEFIAQDNRDWQRGLNRIRTRDIARFWRGYTLKAPAVDMDQPEYLNEVKFDHSTLANPIIIGYNPDEVLDLDDFNGLNIEGTWYGNYCGVCAKSVHGILNEMEEAADSLCGKQYVLDVISNHNEKMEGLGVDTSEWKHYSDFCPKPDCIKHIDTLKNNGRPFEIIDGQHRTRGINHPENSISEHDAAYGACFFGELHTKEDCASDCGKDVWKDFTSPTREPIGFSMMMEEDEGDDVVKAKVFIDINTRAEDLAPTHKLTMLWRHNIHDGKIVQWEEVGLDFTDETTEEYLIYYLILEMTKTSSDHDQTKNRIPLLIAKTNEEELVSVKRLRSYLKELMQPNRIFSGYNSTARAEQYAKIFNKYLNAWAYHYSDPIDEADPSKRWWTPSHKKYGEGVGKDDATVEHLAKTVSKSHKGSGGYFQTTTQSASEEEMNLGEVHQTGLLKVVFELFPIISIHLLKKKALADGVDWEDSLLGTKYIATCGELTESNYRAQIARFKNNADIGEGTVLSKIVGLKNPKLAAEMIAGTGDFGTFSLGWLD